VKGETYRLEAVKEDDSGELFLIFGDRTNGVETYGGGRFLYTAPPKDGTVVVDFNRAVNPPCVFTPYATCPLRPPPTASRSGSRQERSPTDALTGGARAAKGIRRKAPSAREGEARGDGGEAAIEGPE